MRLKTTTIQKIIITYVLLLAITIIWNGLELLTYHQVQVRAVDEIVTLLLLVIFYKASGKMLLRPNTPNAKPDIIKNIIKTYFLVLFVSSVWIVLELVIYHEIQSRIVDDLMMVVMLPIFYKSVS